MILQDKDNFIKASSAELASMYDTVASLNSIELSSLDSEQTALIVIDMINGFVKEGALYSDRVLNLEEPVVSLCKKCSEYGIPMLALCDCHTDESTEFASFPPHCLQNTVEAELTDSLKQFEFTVVCKNSAGALSVPEFEKWLSDNEQIKNYIIVGDCTDICIYQNAVGIKARNNNLNKPCRVIVPVDLIDTYDLPGHNADFINITHICSMMCNGIEAVKTIK